MIRIPGKLPNTTPARASANAAPEDAKRKKCIFNGWLTDIQLPQARYAQASAAASTSPNALVDIPIRQPARKIMGNTSPPRIIRYARFLLRRIAVTLNGDSV